jgi:hypothetical protein
MSIVTANIDVASNQTRTRPQGGRAPARTLSLIDAPAPPQPLIGRGLYSSHPRHALEVRIFLAGIRQPDAPTLRAKPFQEPRR